MLSGAGDTAETQQAQASSLRAHVLGECAGLQWGSTGLWEPTAGMWGEEPGGGGPGAFPAKGTLERWRAWVWGVKGEKAARQRQTEERP